MKIYYYSNKSKYKKITGLDKTAIILSIIGICFILFYLTLAIGDEEGISYLMAIIMFSCVLPISFFLSSYFNKKMRLLDCYYVDNDNNIYYIKVINEQYMRNKSLGEKLKDIDYITNLVKKSRFSNEFKVVKIKSVNKIIENKNYYTIIFKWNNQSKPNKLYIMKDIMNCDELINILKK